jgi:Carbohydrate binding domain
MKTLGLSSELCCRPLIVLGLLWFFSGLGFTQTNLLTNPGFESGNTAGWSTWGCSLQVQASAAHTGSQGGQVTGRAAEWHSATRNLLPVVVPGQGYRTSLWVRPASGTNLEISLNLKQTDANGDTYRTLDTRVCPAGQWSELVGGFAFAPVGTATEMTLYLFCTGNSNRNYDVDDLVLQTESVQVNLASPSGAVSTVGSGFLFGMTATEPGAKYFEGIKPKLVRFHGNVDGSIGWGFSGGGTGFSSPAFMARLANAGAQRQVVVSDEYMWKGYHTSWGWPGDAAHNGYGPYDLIDQSIDSLMASAASNGYQGIQWDIWNEPDYPYFWGSSQAQFFATWKHMYDRIRTADANAIIVGPSIANFVANNEEGGWLKAFLLFAKANNCLPNILSWHEMVWDKHIPGQAQIMRDFMAANGISDRPIQINEYLAWGDDFTLSPGRTATFLAGLEKANVSGAAHAVWDETSDGLSNGLFDGRLGGIMTQNAPYQPRAPWHVYNSYAQMTGNRVTMSDGALLRGVASLDPATSEARILVGNEGAQAFSSNLIISGLEALPGFAATGRIRVRVREIPFSGTNALAAPTDVSYQTLTPGANQVTIPIGVTARAAYEIALFAAPETQLATNGAFSAGSPVFGNSPTSWNATIGASGVGQFTPGGGPQSPLSGQVAYMEAGTQILQTLPEGLQPNTRYTVSFQAYVSVSDGISGDLLAGAVAYGTGSGASSGYAGAISSTEIASGSASFSASLSTAPKSFSFSFTTKPSITGSEKMLAVYLNPVFTGGEQLYLDNVSVTAADASLPTLSITSANENAVTLSWPTHVTGYALETSTTLAPSTWTTVPGVINNTVTLPITVPKMFFRLRQTP